MIGNGVSFYNFKSNGMPFIMVSRGGRMHIGRDFFMNNGLNGNPIGRPQRCTFIVGKNARLEIKNNVGVSSTAIVCHQSIVIGNNVKIGGGVCIYDTDFHSLNPIERRNPKIDVSKKKNHAIEIEDDVFIGAHSTILKGVKIGKNSIVGACSVVTRNIPENQIWAGNPAKFIRCL